MRVKHAIRNVRMGLFYQVIMLILNFISRKVFLDTLGPEYAGLNTLFNNIIAMFSLAEMGVGTAIIYNLYKPLAEGNEKEVAGLMQLYKKFYWTIGLVVGSMGMCFIACLPYFINESSISSHEVLGAYGIFLFGTVLTYLTGHKRSLLYADQKNYILLVGDMVIGILGTVLGMAVLIFRSSYMAYCVIYMGTKVIPNIWGTYKVKAYYPYIEKYKEPLPPQTKLQVKQNVRDLFIHKSSEFVVNSTDSLILSSFIGLEMVGRVGNYTLITAALMTLIAQIINGLQASMGHLAVAGGKERVKEVFERFSFMMFLLTSFCITSLMCLVQPFISIWLGEGYILEKSMVLVIGLNFLLWMLTRPLWQQMSVTGLFKEDRINAILEMLINLIISILLVIKLGTIGVFIGTACSYLVAWSLKSRLLYQSFFQTRVGGYYRTMLGYLVLAVIEVSITYGICLLLPPMLPVVTLGMRSIICVLIPNGINALLFRKHPYVSYMRQLLKEGSMKIIDNLNKPKVKEWLQKGVFVILMILLFIIPLERALDESLRIYGKLAALGIFAITNGYILWRVFIDRRTGKPFKKAILMYAGLGILLLIVSFITGRMAGVKASLLMLLMINVGIACGLIDYGRLGRCLWIVDIGMITYLYLAYRQYGIWKEEASWGFYAFIFNNTNYLGLILVCFILINVLCWGISYKKHYFLYSFMCLILIRASGTRTAFLAIAACIGSYILWEWVSKHKVKYYLFIMLILGGIIGFTVIYPGLKESEFITQISSQVSSISKKSLFSGREDIWAEALSYIKQKPIQGYGMEIAFEVLNQKGLSVHNMYLQLLLQGGLIAISIFSVCLIGMWHNLYEVRDQKLVRVGASCLISILIIGVFELTLLGQSISLGCLQWMIIGISISVGIRKRIGGELQEC